MDEVIFEEFKGTGNSETILDRKISEKEYIQQLILLNLEQEEKNCYLIKMIFKK